MTEKYFLKGYVMKTTTVSTLNETAKLTAEIHTEDPLDDGDLCKWDYTVELTTPLKMCLHMNKSFLCEISEDENGKLTLDHVYIDVEDL